MLIDILNIIAGIASIIGLLVSLYTLYKVANLPTALKQQSRDKQMSEVIDRINRIPHTKPTIPDSTAREVEVLVKTVRLYYVSKIPFRQSRLKSMLVTLEGELKSQKQTRVVQLNLGLIRDEITIR